MGLGEQTTQNLENDKELRLKPQFNKILANSLDLSAIPEGVFSMCIGPDCTQDTKGTSSGRRNGSSG